MEENQNQENVEAQEKEETSFQAPPQSGVSFPTSSAPKKSGGAKTLLIVGILILVGILGFVIYKSASQKSAMTAEPTPFDNLTSTSDNTAPVTEPVATATPSAADKGKVAIQVLNGTGISGEAAYLQNQLKDLGYTDVQVGNSSDQSATETTVTFSSSLDSGVVAEITNRLKSLYQTVTTKTSSSGSFDVSVTTGLRKGSTPKPQATAAPSATPSPTPTATP